MSRSSPSPRSREDKDSADPGQLPTYNAYAGEGDVTEQLVYVNYGIPEDYDKLKEMGIDVTGKIAIARYGKSWRGIKAKLAQTHGAVGCLIYSDPRDDGYFQGLTYPEGPYRPEWGVQRGSIMDMPVHPGDPLSPGFGAKTGQPRLAIADATTLIKIPVLPISYGDALPLLRDLRGQMAPESWRGALPIAYHVGPGPSKVHLKLSLDMKTRPLYNVIARIDGSLFPDEWIIHGNHHDAWDNGADDPISGQVALMETARSLAALVKQGWKPKRTIILAAWDGEEWGLLGSTEWAETHKDELLEKGVVYINSDSTGKGWLGMAGSHTLQELVNDVARNVTDPERGVSVWEAARARAIDRAATDEEKKEIEQSDDLRIDALGFGLRLHRLSRSPDDGVPQSRVRRREPRWHLPFRLRHLLLVHPLLRRRFPLRASALPGHRHRHHEARERHHPALQFRRPRRHHGTLRGRDQEDARRESRRSPGRFSLPSKPRSRSSEARERLTRPRSRIYRP